MEIPVAVYLYSQKKPEVEWRQSLKNGIFEPISTLKPFHPEDTRLFGHKIKWYFPGRMTKAFVTVIVYALKVTIW